MFNQKTVCVFLTLLMIISTSLTVITTNKHTDSSSGIKLLDEARMTHSESDRCADHPLIENTIVSSAESTLFYDNEAMLWNGTQEITPNSGWSDFSNANATWIWPYIQAPGTYDFIHHFTLQSGAYDVEFHWSGLTDDAFIPSSSTDYFTSMQDESTGEFSLVHISLAGGYSASTIPYDTTNHPDLTSVSNLEYDAGTGILYGTAYDDANSELEFVSIDITNGLVSSIGTMPHADSGMSTFGGFSASISIASNMNWIMDIADPPYSSSNPDHYDEIELGTGEIQGVPDSLNLSLQITARNRNSSSGSTTPGGLIYDLDISYCVNPDLSDVDGDGVFDGEDAFIWNPYEWNDTDHDHIGDNSDICPDTPFGEWSNPDGCSNSQLDIQEVPMVEYLDQPFYTYHLPFEGIEFFPSMEHFELHPEGNVNITIELNETAMLDEWLEVTGIGGEQAPAEGDQILVEASVLPEGMLSVRNFSVEVESVLRFIAQMDGIVSITDTDMIPPPFLTSFATSNVNPNSVLAADVHRASDAWAAGFDGTGINVGITDTGVDFSSPALRGTQARVTDASSPYDGWPIMYDQNGMDTWLLSGRYVNGYVNTAAEARDDLPASTVWHQPDGDGFLDTKFTDINLVGGSGYGYYSHYHTTTSTGTGSGMVVWVHTKGVSGVVDDIEIVDPGSGYSTGDIITITDNHPDGTPWGSKTNEPNVPSGGQLDHTSHSHGNNDASFELQGWTVGFGLSKSGDYHFGSRKIWSDSDHGVNIGSRNILVTDANTAGVYDTVIVDLNNNYDFTDDHKMVKGSEAGGYAYWNQMVNGQPDKVWDVSSGMIYWISDGVNGVPYGDTRAATIGGLNRIAGAGDIVLFMEDGGSAAGHGTMCASAVAGQGNLANGYGQGMAPGAKIITTWPWDPKDKMSPTPDENYHFLYRGYDGIPNTGDEADIISYSFGVPASGGLWSAGISDRGATVTEFASTGNSGPHYTWPHSIAGVEEIIGVGAFTSLEMEQGGGTWGQPAQFSSRGLGPLNNPLPSVVAVGAYHADAVPLNGGDSNGGYHNGLTSSMWTGTSLASPIAAGIGALAMQAHLDEYGTQPTRAQMKDYLMSTTQNTGHDVFTQGAGLLDAKRAVDAIKGDDYAVSMSPGIWNSGTRTDERFNGLKYNLPGDHDSSTLTISNNGNVPVTISATPSELVPVKHSRQVWHMDGEDNWDGLRKDDSPLWFNDNWVRYGDVQYPDLIIPIQIEGDSDFQIPLDSVLVRARANTASGSSGEVGSKLAFIRWTDVDGDGKWMDDQLGDGLILDHQNEWAEPVEEFSFLDYTSHSSAQSITYVGNPFEVGGDGILLAVWRTTSGTQEDYFGLEIDWTAFGYNDSGYLSFTAPEDDFDGGDDGRSASLTSTFDVPANGEYNLSVYLDIPSSSRSEIIQHGIMFFNYGTAMDTFWPVITYIADDGTFDYDETIVDHDLDDQKLYSNHWTSGNGQRKLAGDLNGFSPDGYLFGWIDTSGSSTVESTLISSAKDGLNQIDVATKSHGYGSYDVPFSSHLHYYGPVTERLESIDPGGQYPYISNQYIASTDSNHYRGDPTINVHDVYIDDIISEKNIFKDQESLPDIAFPNPPSVWNNPDMWTTNYWPTLPSEAPTFNWMKNQILVSGKPMTYRLDCKNSNEKMNLFIIEDNGDGGFTMGVPGPNGMDGDLFDTSTIFQPKTNGLTNTYWGNLMKKVGQDANGNYGYRPYEIGGCGSLIEYTPKATGIGWLAVQCGVDTNLYRESNIADGFCDFDISRFDEQPGFISVDSWNMLNLATTSIPWNSVMSGIGNGDVKHVLEVEISHQDTISITQSDMVFAKLRVIMTNNHVLTFPYTYQIQYIESTLQDLDIDKASDMMIEMNELSTGAVSLSGLCDPGASLTIYSGDWEAADRICEDDGRFGLEISAENIDYKYGIKLTHHHADGEPVEWHTDVAEPSKEEPEEDSGFLGLPGFGIVTMLLAMLSAAFVGRRKKYG